ncbi:MAG TPA: DUF2334 domain-containing protein [Pseudonocardiaceae bacterium]|jgi:hypothetical protein|nr:DUF2334 domain-containing protein [Pseudonocardiaceae bacterium]
MTACLVVSLSGITADSLDEADRFAGELAERGVPLSLLVPPRRRAGSRAALDWIADRTARGDALVLHGLGDGSAGRLRWRGAECAVLPAHEAGLKMLAARVTLEHLGLATECFAPPGWLASRGLLTALRRHGFRLCAELHGVRDLDTDEVTGGRVFGFACHPRVEPWWCLAGVLQAARLARRGGLLRLSVPAGDLARSGVRQAVLDAVDIGLHHDARPTTYRELAGAPVDHTSVSSPRGSTVTVEPVGARFANNP